MATLNDMSESEFRKLAIDSVVEWWNQNNDLVDEFGDISADDVYYYLEMQGYRQLQGTVKRFIRWRRYVAGRSITGRRRPEKGE